jgi:serine protease 16
MLLTALCLLIVFADALRHRMDNWSHQKPRTVLKDDPYTKYYTEQTLDHFDGTNTKTWVQRYFVNDTFWDGTGSVFLCVGGEGPPLETDVVVTGDVHCADMVTLAPQHKALILAVEHRYYGESLPTPDFTTPNLKWLSSQQALADLAQIRTYLSGVYGMTSNNRWVSWGGSYPGMLSAWFRLKYPHLVWAAVSSSAPVRAEANMEGYNDVVGQSIAAEIVGGSGECLSTVQAAFSALGSQLSSSNGRRYLENIFNVCVKYSLDDVNNQMDFMDDLTYLFPAQENDPACTTLACNISSVCNAVMLNSSYGSDPLTRLASLSNITQGGSCMVVNYKLTLDALSATSLIAGTERIWFYQTCTEFGFYQTCDPTSQCPFTTSPWLDTLQASFDQCQFAFGVLPSTINFHVNQSNFMYGADQTAGTRIMFVNGQIDPWHANSVLEPLSTDEPAYWVEGASHHYWTHPPLPTDTPEIVQARQAIWDQVNTWLELPDD